jgi:hypothetical protein
VVVGVFALQVAIPIQKPGKLQDVVTDYRLQFSFDGKQLYHKPAALVASKNTHICSRADVGQADCTTDKLQLHAGVYDDDTVVCTGPEE